MITQKKIAELAGVSRGTVDRVLNNRCEVSPEIQKKVLEIAKMLNYKPNRAAKSLVLQQKALKIGCIIVQADNAFIDQLIQGINQKAIELEEYGVEVIFHRVLPDQYKIIKKIDELLEVGINGLIIQPTTEKNIADKLKTVADMNIPIVTLNGDAFGFEHCYIGNDFYKCGEIAANLLDLITAGTCKVGILTGFFIASAHVDRVNGFKDYIKDRPNMQIVVCEENYDDDFESYRKTERMLREYPEIDALFIAAGGTFGACRALKTFPDYSRIRVVCFDVPPATRELVKDGTIQGAICQQPIRQGELALEVLFDYFVDPSKPLAPKLYTDISIKLKSNIDI